VPQREDVPSPSQCLLSSLSCARTLSPVYAGVPSAPPLPRDAASRQGPGQLGSSSRSPSDSNPSTRATILATTVPVLLSPLQLLPSHQEQQRSSREMDWEKAAKVSSAAPFFVDLKPGAPDLALETRTARPLPVTWIPYGLHQDTPVSSLWKVLGEKVRPGIGYTGERMSSLLLPLPL